MSITQKRNPFKRSATKTGSTSKNPLSHLTDKVIGFRGHVDDNLSGCEPIETNKESEDIENVDTNTNCEVNVSFLTYFVFF